MATNIKIETNVVLALPTIRPLPIGAVYKVAQPDGTLLTYTVNSLGDPVFERGIDNSQLAKLTDLDTQSEIDAKIAEATSNANSGLIPVTTLALPRGGSIPSYVTDKGKATLRGNSVTTTVYTNTGTTPSTITVPVGSETDAFYDKATDTWTAGRSQELPQVEIENDFGQSVIGAASQKLVTDAISTTINRTYVVGTANADTGIITPVASAAFYMFPMSDLNNIDLLKIRSRTYNAAQPSIYYYTKVDFDTYTLVSSARFTEDVELKQSDFPVGATHYLVQSISALAPDSYVIELRNSVSVLSEKSTETEEYSDILFNPTTYKFQHRVEEVTGRAYPALAYNQYVTDFGKVNFGSTYQVIGYIFDMYFYDINKNLIGKSTSVGSNAEITITLEGTVYARAVFVSNLHNAFFKLAVTTVIGTHTTTMPPVNSKSIADYPEYLLRGIDIQGDSMIGITGIPEQILQATGRTNAYASYGGMISSFIRDRFLLNGNKNDYINIFWIGQNNANQIETVIYDLNLMINSLNHNRWLIITQTVGSFPNLITHNAELSKISALETAIRKCFGEERTIVQRELIINGAFDNEGAKLEVPFTQPTINSDIIITVKSADALVYVNPSDSVITWIPSQNNILIGLDGLFDKYSIKSATDNGNGTHSITLTLLEINRIPTGGTVTNPVLSAIPSGTTTPISYTKLLILKKEVDTFLINIGAIPSSLRRDNLHYNSFGGKMIAKLIKNKLMNIKDF